MSGQENSFAEMKLALPIVERFKKRLGNLFSAEVVEHGSSDSRHFKIETEKGVWFLKKHPTSTIEAQLTAEQTIVAALVDNGFALGVPYVVSDEDKPFFKFSDRLWTINRYVDDYPKFDWTKPNWPVETCVSAAAGLAQMHIAGYRMLKRSTSAKSQFTKAEINTFTTKFDQAVQQLERGSDLAAPGLEDFTESTTWLREEVSTTIKHLREQNTGALPTVVHGDYHAGNTLFQGDRLLAIVDLHYVHLGSPLYDLAYGAVMFGTNWLKSESLQDGNDSSPALPEFQASFVMAYRKAIRQLSTEPAWLAAVSDSALLNKYMKLACFLIMHWALEPTESQQEVQTRNRVYVNALGLLRHLDYP